MANPIPIIPGAVYGRLTVLNEAELYWQPCGKSCRMVNCMCICGNKVTTLWYSIRKGLSTSCGCYNKEINGKRIAEASRTHGDTPVGYSEYKSLYFVWNTMKQRCYNENTAKYKNYGAKGIKVCDEWNTSFAAFKAWSISNGYYKQPACTPFKDKLSIDRLNPLDDYTPENCVWVSISENTSRRHAFNKLMKSISENEQLQRSIPFGLAYQHQQRFSIS